MKNYKVILETIGENLGYTIKRGDAYVSWNDMSFEEKKLIVSMLYQAADYYALFLNPSVKVREDIKIKYNFNREIYKGLTIKDMIDYLEPLVDEVMRGNTDVKPFTNRYVLGKFCKINQPRYHRLVPDVVKYFADKYNIN